MNYLIRPNQTWVTGHTEGTLKANTAPIVALATPPTVGGAVSSPASVSTESADPGGWRRRMSFSNPNETVGFYGQVQVDTLDNQATAKANTLKSWIYVPPSREQLIHDPDGNLVRDARWTYQWDGENRLVVMEERDAIPFYPSNAVSALPRQRLEFDYDAHSRRTGKRVYRRSGTGSSATWTPWAYTVYIYDGWNLIAELDMLNLGQPTRSYAWGTDLSGSLSGAGGVGGLLLTKRHQYTATTATTRVDKSEVHWVHSDGNGNIMGLYSITAARVSDTGPVMVGQCDYDAFGQKVTNTVAMGNEVCPFGFSSKYEDKETGLLYYGFRYYSPEIGRWLSRDPIGERGGVNLYGMCGNDAVNYVDLVGHEKLSLTYDVSGDDSWKMKLHVTPFADGTFMKMSDALADAKAKVGKHDKEGKCDNCIKSLIIVSHGGGGSILPADKTENIFPQASGGNQKKNFEQQPGVQALKGFDALMCKGGKMTFTACYADDPEGQLKSQLEDSLDSDVDLAEGTGGMFFGNPVDRPSSPFGNGKPGYKHFK
jgi:RHS repeat-associated protein